MLKHLIMDIDGVLSTGHFFYSEEGKMYKVFGAHDRDGVILAAKLGLTVNFITADSTGFKISYARIVTDWGFSPDNLSLVPDGGRLKWIEDHFDLDEVVYIGDGIHDALILEKVAVGIAPNNARREAKDAANYVTESNAGSGAVLDAVLILQGIMRKYDEKI